MRSRALLTGTLLLAVGLAASEALAQGAGPFGVGRPEAAFAARDFGPLAPVVQWIAQQQSELYRGFAAAVRAVKTDWTAAAGLIGLAFLYGVLHAAGPGHGKAVIASYLFATNETLKRGIAVSMVSALVQGLTAIALVGALAVVFNATSRVIGQWSGYLEAASYGLVIVLGLGLMLRKLWALRPRPQMASLSAAAVASGTDAACCAVHAVAPERFAGRFDLKTAAAAVGAVGLRPCTGAVLILIFALGQGVFAVGVAAVLAMSIGTGLTVAALALLAVGAKGLAVRLAARRPAWAVAVGHALEWAGAAALVLFGTLFLMSALVR